MQKDVRKFLFYILLLSIFALGILARTKLYMVMRPFWKDESMLYFCLRDRTYLGFFSALDNFQSAPPLFLISEKAMTILFGIKEGVLRFIPFICSILSIPLFYLFSVKFLDKKWTILAANFLFAINAQLLYYSQEFKQYSSDVFIFLLLFIILNGFTLERTNIKKNIWYCIMTVIAPLFSITSYFVVGAWFFREIFIYGKKNLTKLLLMQIPLCLMTIFYLITTIIPQHNNMLYNYANSYGWKESFITFDFMHNIQLLRDNFIYFYVPNKIFILLFLFAAISLYVFIKNFDKEKNGVLLLCLTLTIILFCSLLRLYPFYERIILYLLPIFIIFATKPLDILSKNKLILSILIFALFVLSFGRYDVNYLKKCFSPEIFDVRHTTPPGMRQIMEILKDKYVPEDILVINAESKTEYEYYKDYFKFYPKKEIYIDKICNQNDFPIPKGKKLWFVSSQTSNWLLNDVPEIAVALNKYNDHYKILFQKMFAKGQYLFYIEF